jgi:uncharacterized protein YkwD
MATQICSVNMRKKFLFILLILATARIFSQEDSNPLTPDFKYYKNLNEKEQRLSEFKDNDDALKIKLIQLEVINKSRKKFKAEPVKLDILASRVANKMCREAAENKYVGHWNLAGEKPYHRYAFAGGYDHVSENAYGSMTSGDYVISNSLVTEMMKKGHDDFMSERAPNDGHKKNIIEKSHNYVGLGYYITDDQFRYYEEYIDRYLEFENIPSRLRVGEQGSITVTTDGKVFPYFLIAYRERFPQAQKAAQIMSKGSYEDYSGEEALNIPAWDLAKYKRVNTYRIPLRFSKEGLYYIQLFIDKKENTGTTALNTKGKTVATGIVIRVEK